MKKKLFLGLLCGASLFTACTQEDVLDAPKENPGIKYETNLTTKEAQMKFARILSKAVSNDVDLRRFLQKEAVRQFDNDYDVFYPLTKDKEVADGRTFRDVLLAYCKDAKELEEIERSQLLLNILIPDLTLFWDFDAERWNPNDEEVVVICRSDKERTMFENGESIGNMDKGEIPGFPCLVIKDNERMVVSSARTRAGEPVYEFADEAFDGSKRKDMPCTRSEWDEYLETPEDLTKPVPASEFKADIVKAWQELKGIEDAYQRDYIYYGIGKDNKPGKLNRNIREELYRFRLMDETFVSISDEVGKDPVLQNTSKERRELTHEEILDKIWSGGNFDICFRSYIATDKSAGSMEHKLVFSIPARQLFSVEKVHVKHKHSTAFRHSKNTYIVSPNDLRSKWYYPERGGYGSGENFIFLFPWDLYDHSVSVIFFVEEIDNTRETTVKKTLLHQFTNKADFSFGIDGGTDPKYNTKLGYGFSSLHSETSETTITTQEGSDELGTLAFFYFDPIIRYQEGNGYQLMNVSSGSVQATILPRDLLVQ